MGFKIIANVLAPVDVVDFEDEYFRLNENTN